MSVRIEGALVALAPIHQTQPGVQGWLSTSSDGGRLRLSYTDTGQGQCQVMMAQTIFDLDRRPRQVPYVTGNSINGVLRRKAAAHVLRALGQPVRTELFQVLSAGAFHKRDMGGDKSADMIVGAARNVFVGLFGGGGSSFARGTRSCDLLPVTATTQHLVPLWVYERYAIPMVEDGNGKLFEPTLTQIYSTIRRDPLLDGEGVHYIHDHSQAYADAIAADAADRKIKKASKAGESEVEAKSDRGLRMMSYCQAIAPGVPLSARILFTAAMTDAHVGLLLLALNDFVNDQKLAGVSRRGFGLFKPDLRLYAPAIDGHVDLFEPVLTEARDSVERYRLSDAVAHYVEAAQAELAKMTIAELEDLLVTTRLKAAA